MEMTSTLGEMLVLILIFLFPVNGQFYHSNDNITNKLDIYPREVEVQKGEKFTLSVKFSYNITECTALTWKSSPVIITTIPESVTLCQDVNDTELSWDEEFLTTAEGIVNLMLIASPDGNIDTSEAFSKVHIALHNSINLISVIIGWCYVFAWDLSFLPQILHNYKRKSVVGLSFDFLVLNFIGFASYSIFNLGFYCVDSIQEQYLIRNPTSVLHVRLNDVVFPIYACLCTIVQIGQCFYYQKGKQKFSWTCKIISTLMISSCVIYAITSNFVESLWWIDVLYWFSYIKILVTLVKYTPQLLINYKLKSTEGWSIWQVTLDFTGGSFSLLQMILLAYNFNDWYSMMTDPAKVGLGLLSILYNILFFVQHFCLYRKRKISIPNEKQVE